MSKKASPWKYPFSLFRDAVVNYASSARRGNDRRDEFFVTVQPLVQCYVENTLLNQGSDWKERWYGDVVSYVNLKLIENWYPSFTALRWLRGARRVGSEDVRIYSCLRWFKHSVWGYVLNYFTLHEKQGKYEKGYDHVGGSWFTDVVDERVDRELVRDAADRLLIMHMATRRGAPSGAEQAAMVVAERIAVARYVDTGGLIA